MKTGLRLSLSVLALALPIVALAAPGNVSGIKATAQADGVHVQWNKAGGDVTGYKVFYSHASILNNAGLFDEYEEASGTETAHVLKNVPQTPDLYVAVLAVDSQGNESPFFAEEAHVVLNGDTPSTDTPSSQAADTPAQADASSSAAATSTMSSAASSAMPAPTQQEDVLRLLSIDVVSATGVVLHFSRDVSVDPAHATEALTIETASGTKLAMKRFVIQGKDIHVDTDVQERGTAYKVTVGTAISALGNAGQKLAISPDEAPVLFSGHPDGREPATPAMPSTVRTEVVQLRLRAQPTGTSYRTETTWQPAGGSVKSYTLSQTTDDGRTFTGTRTVSPDQRDIIVSGVPAGTFGVKVQTVYTDGTVSKGIVQTIDLPSLGGVTGSVIKTPGGSTTLPNSGPALWVAISGAIAVATWMQMKRKETSETLA